MTFLIFSSVIIFLLLTIISGEKNTYRAATVEYEPYTPQNTTDPMHLMLANAVKYAEYAAAAAQQNADIIVFPEHGILSILADKDNHHFVYTRDGLLPYFQTVPNPKTVSWNPCVNPSDYNNTEILFEISCSARNNSIAILANILSREEYTRLGTGIYSSQLGALNETFDISRKGQLIIADVPIQPSPVPEGSLCSPSIQAAASGLPHTEKESVFTPFIITNQPSSKPFDDSINKIYYQSLVNFTAFYLKESQGNVSLCRKSACCNLVYSLSRNSDSGIQALMAFDGEHEIKTKKLRIQTCAVMRCERENDIESCGRMPEIIPSALFNTMSLTAQLEADVVVPSVLLAAKNWSYSHRKCEEEKSESKIELINHGHGNTVIVVGLYGRLYSQDTEV
uniref:CN hydrolase domain-containing protein n=1 Tax=Strigamia maritima TaxID=126957 RepID=T1JDU6_STRMM